jgi:hypothetical protein
MSKTTLASLTYSTTDHRTGLAALPPMGAVSTDHRQGLAALSTMPPSAGAPAGLAQLPRPETLCRLCGHPETKPTLAHYLMYQDHFESTLKSL